MLDDENSALELKYTIDLTREAPRLILRFEAEDQTSIDAYERAEGFLEIVSETRSVVVALKVEQVDKGRMFLRLTTARLATPDNVRARKMLSMREKTVYLHRLAP